MKHRIGFVSNSSSSSFIVREKTNRGSKTIYEGRADYNAIDPSEGQGLEQIINGIIEALGHDPDDYEIEWND